MTPYQKQILLLILKLKRMIFEIIKNIIIERKMKTLQTLTFLSCVYQYFFHRKWWSGFLDSLRLFIFHAHQRRKSYVQQSITASDGEQYTIWTPKKQKCLYDPTSRQHIWICAPGGMESIDLGMTALHRLNIFKQSKICMFNNPGISNKLKKIPLPSPTSTQYLIEYIQYLQTKHNLDVSLIGFSIGSVQVLRTLHTLSNTDKYSMYTHTHLHISNVNHKSICVFLQKVSSCNQLYWCMDQTL